MTESGSVLNCQCKMIRGLIYLGCNNHKVIKGHFGLYSLYQVRIEIRITIDIFPTEDRKIDLFPLYKECLESNIIYMESSLRMPVRGKGSVLHAGRRSLESFLLLKEVIGEREVRRKEGEATQARQRRGGVGRVLKVATRKV